MVEVKYSNDKSRAVFSVNVLISKSLKKSNIVEKFEKGININLETLRRNLDSEIDNFSSYFDSNQIEDYKSVRLYFCYSTLYIQLGWLNPEFRKIMTNIGKLKGLIIRGGLFWVCHYRETSKDFWRDSFKIADKSLLCILSDLITDMDKEDIKDSGVGSDIFILNLIKKSLEIYENNRDKEG